MSRSLHSKRTESNDLVQTSQSKSNLDCLANLSKVFTPRDVNFPHQYKRILLTTFYPHYMTLLSTGIIKVLQTEETTRHCRCYCHWTGRTNSDTGVTDRVTDHT